MDVDGKLLSCVEGLLLGLKRISQSELLWHACTHAPVAAVGGQDTVTRVSLCAFRDPTHTHTCIEVDAPKQLQSCSYQPPLALVLAERHQCHSTLLYFYVIHNLLISNLSNKNN